VIGGLFKSNRLVRIFSPNGMKIMELFNFFRNGKKKKEQLLEERQVFLDQSIEKSGRVQEESLHVQKNTTEIAGKNFQLNEQLTGLVIDNERKSNILLERENKIQATQDELEERKKEVRRGEIEITARNAEVRKNEHAVRDRQNKLNDEEIRIKERENEAEKIKTESESEITKYQTLYEELEAEKTKIKTFEEEARRKNQEAEEKSAAANAVFERAKTIDTEIKAKEAKFEEHRLTIEESLKKKIDEYDRKIADLNAVKGIVDDIKFDESKEGHDAKIVVKEAIRQAKKSLEDIQAKFAELDEKYASGTFKGFSTPLTEIDRNFEELKSQYTEVKAHLASQSDLPASTSQLLNQIEECINNADKCCKSWEFSEAYRHIVFGLATCRNYETLLTILHDFGGDSSEESNMPQADDFKDWYEILEVKPDATEAEINKQWRKLQKIYHPDTAPEDKNKTDEHHEKSVLINQAHDILTDAEKRKKFDQQRNSRKERKTS